MQNGWRTRILIALVALVAALPTACAQSTVTPDHSIKLRRHGGLCPTDDGGGVCEYEVRVNEDGWTATGTPQATPSTGAITQETFDELVAVLDDGFDDLTAEPFTGTCPTAYDGQEITVELWTIPNDPLADASGSISTSCTHDWETATASAVIERVNDLVEEAGIPW